MRADENGHTTTHTADAKSSSTSASASGADRRPRVPSRHRLALSGSEQRLGGARRGLGAARGAPTPRTAVLRATRGPEQLEAVRAVARQLRLRADVLGAARGATAEVGGRSESSHAEHVLGRTHGPLCDGRHTVPGRASRRLRGAAGAALTGPARMAAPPCVTPRGDRGAQGPRTQGVGWRPRVRRIGTTSCAGSRPWRRRGRRCSQRSRRSGSRSLDSRRRRFTIPTMIEIEKRRLHW